MAQDLEDYSAFGDPVEAEADDYSAFGDPVEEPATAAPPAVTPPSRLGDRGGPALRRPQPGADHPLMKPGRDPLTGQNLNPETKEVGGSWYVKRGPDVINADTGDTVADPTVLEAFGRSQPAKRTAADVAADAALGERVDGATTIRHKDGTTIAPPAYERVRAPGQPPPAPKDQARVTAEGDEPGYFSEFTRAATKGVIDTAATVLKGAAGLTTDDPRKVAQVMTDIARVGQMDEPTFQKFFQEIPLYAQINPIAAFDYRRAAQAYRRGDKAKGDAFLAQAQGNTNIGDVEKSQLFQAGEKLSGLAAQPEFQPKGDFGPESITVQLGQGAGSMLAMLPAGLFGRLPGLTATSLSAGAGEAMENVQQEIGTSRREDRAGLYNAGLGEEARSKVLQGAKLGTIPGATDIVPIEILLERLPSVIPGLRQYAGTGLWRRAAKAIGQTATQMGVEGGQEGAQQYLQNVITQLTVNPEKDVTEDVLNSIAIGGAVGGMVQAPLSVAEALRPGQSPGVTPPPPGTPGVPPPPGGPVPPGGGPESGVETSGATSPTPKEGEGPQPLNSEQVATLLDQAGYTDQELVDMRQKGELGPLYEIVRQTGVVPPKGYKPPPRTPSASRTTVTIDGKTTVTETRDGQPVIREGPDIPETEDYTADGEPIGDGSKTAPTRVASEADIAPVRERVAEPTEGQKGANNYRQAHVKIAPLPGKTIAIETPKGGMRRGKDSEGKPWEVQMPADYGRIKGTLNSDGEEMDITIGPNPGSRRIYAIDQRDPKTGKHDEWKTFAGFESEDDAIEAYEASFSDGSGSSRIRAVEEMDASQIDDFLNRVRAETEAAKPKPKSVTDKPISVGQKGAQNNEPVFTISTSNEAAKSDTPELGQPAPLPDQGLKPVVVQSDRGEAKTSPPPDSTKKADAPIRENRDYRAELLDTATRGSSAPAVQHENGRNYRVKKDGDTFIGLRLPPKQEAGKPPSGLPPSYLRPPKGEKWTKEQATDKLLDAIAQGDKWGLWEKHPPIPETKPAETTTEKPKAETEHKKDPDRKLRDFGDVDIHGYADGLGDRTRDDGGGNQTKVEFLKDAQGYFGVVSKILRERGFVEGKDKKGKSLRAIRVNEGGPAGAGDVYFELKHPDHKYGFQAQIGHGLMGKGTFLVVRPTDNRGLGNNNWLGNKLTARELADRIERLTNPGGVPKAAPVEAPAPKAEPAATKPPEPATDFDDSAGAAALNAIGGTMPAKQIFPPPVKTHDAMDWTPAATPNLTPEEAEARLAEWKAEAKRQFDSGENIGKVILSLYDYTGAWSEPYRQAGYVVVQYDVQEAKPGDEKMHDLLEHFPMADIQALRRAGYEIYGVMSACPCTTFASSGAGWWEKRHNVKSREAIEKVFGDWVPEVYESPVEVNQAFEAVTEAVVETANPTGFHVLENPIGRIRDVTGLPAPLLRFDPNDYGNPYTKRTQLWGDFDPKLPVAPVEAAEGSKISETLRGDSKEDKIARSTTPEGFAYAFFMANNAKVKPGKVIEGKPEFNPDAILNLSGLVRWPDGSDNRGGDEELELLISEKGPWDFLERYPAPDPDAIARLDADGRTVFADPDDAVEVSAVLEETMNELQMLHGDLAELRRLAKAAKASKLTGKNKKLKPATIAAEKAKTEETLANMLGELETVFGMKAAAAINAEALNRHKTNDQSADGMAEDQGPTRLKDREPPAPIIKEAKGKPKASKDEIGDMFDEAVKETAAPKVDAIPSKPARTKAGTKATAAPKSPGAAAKSAVKNTAMGLDEVASGLTKLFGAGKNRLGSGIGWDEETYQAALPLFKAGVAHFRSAGADIREMVRGLVRYLRETAKFSDETLAEIKPYAVQFIDDVQTGKVDLDEDSAGIREDAPGVSQGGETGDPESDGWVGGADDVPQQRRPKRGGSVRGDGSPDDDVTDAADRSGREDGGAGSDTANAGRNRSGKRNLSAEVSRREKERRARADLNYRITDEDRIGQGSAKEKVRANIEAIRILKSLDGRAATPEEKQKLVKYVGWGAFAQDLFDTYRDRPEWKAERADLKNLLSPAEFDAARASTTNAHYTSQDVIKGMWEALEFMGFSGGRALEPSAGVGHFIGLIPDRLRANTDWSAVELDPTTGGIAKALYGGADVNVQGYETFVRPKGFYDLAISNVPFGNYKLRDPKYPRFSIHDYFFVKSLDQVRPGGMVAFITSSHSMDKMDDRARQEIAKRGDLIAAIRLPGGKKGAFAGNAGTEVTTDIIFLRRRPDGAPPSPEAQKWAGLKEISTPDGPTRINEYFVDHPNMMLGTMRLTGTMYGSNEPMLEGNGEPIGPQISEAVRRLPADVFQRESTARPGEPAPKYIDIEGARPGAFFVKDGKVYQNVDNTGVLQSFSSDDVKRVRGLIGLRDIVNSLLGNQAAGGDVAANDRLRKQLHKAYDAFVKEWGPINKTVVNVTNRLNNKGENIVLRKMPNFNAFRRDPDAYKVAAIEMYDPDADRAQKAAIFDADVIGLTPAPVIASALDTIPVSLNKHGRLDTKDMAEMAGMSEDELIEGLGDAVFLNPATRIYEPTNQYLSGDVVTKLNDARQAAQSDRAFEKNVTALEKVQPAPLTREDIGISFGSSWVPKDVFETFIAEEADADVTLTFNDYAKSWGLARTGARSAAAQAKYGTARVDFAAILVAALNSTSLRVTDKQADGSEVVDQDATEQARAKITELQTAFAGNRETGQEGWAYKDEDRASRLEAIYNNQFNRIVPQTFDGSHLTFPGLAKTIKKSNGDIVPFSLRKHQKDAVWRTIQNGNTLLDHVVGAGKTFTMIVSGMERRRLGEISRPTFVVPNHMLEQFSREFLQAYPGANILVASKEEMSADNRRAFAAKVAAQKWDGIIMTHSGFGRIQMSKEAYTEFLRGEIHEASDALEQASAEEGRKSPTVKEIEKAKKRIETKLAELIKAEAKDKGITFEELGIDNIYLDEAHLFKNLNFFTRHTRIKGIGGTASQRATDLFMKIQHIEKRRPGRSAVFATGTPISNTMAEAYTMQRYLQLPVLRAHGIDRFDAWASTFGKVRTQMELAPDGRSLQEVTSFSKFVNIPEMMNIYGLIADTKTAEELNLPRPKVAGGKPFVIEAEPDAMEEDYIASLVQRAKDVKGKRAEKGGDNMLKIVTDGRKVATDRRLIFGNVEWNPNGKVAKAVDNIFRIWKDGQEPAMVQTVFLDLGTPKTGKTAKTKTVTDEETGEESTVDMDESELFRSMFNLYEDMRTRLIQKGIPRSEIAFIHEAADDTKKAQMFDKARRGKIRVLFGSTGKMGVGTNIPDRLIAQHEIDPPWKPAEVEQRGGRIVRQGNMNPEVSIYRYITVRSFDAFMWQTLERKANFIAQMKAGARGLREAEDIDSPLPDAAELKAAATGDPRIMQYAELQKDVRTLEIAQSAHFRTIAQAKGALQSQRSEKARYEKSIAILTADAAKVEDTKGDAFKVLINVGEVPGEYTSRKEAGEQVVKFLAGQMDRMWGKTKIKIGTLSGFGMEVEIDREKQGGLVYSAILKGDGTYSRWRDEAYLTPDTDPVQMMLRFERLLQGILDSLAYEQQQLETINAAIPKIEITAQDKPFPRAAELAAQKAKLKALEEDLKPKKDEATPAGPSQAAFPSDGFGGITEKTREAIAEDVQRYARRILGHNIKVNVVRRIVDKTGKDTGMAGAYSSADQAVYIALDHAVNWRGILRHESIHALRDAGVITAAEWEALSRYARKIWLPRNPHIRETYEGYYTEKMQLTAEQLEELIVEEAVADMFERQRMRTLPDNVPGAIARIIAKVLEFLERVRNLMDGAGYKTAADIFGDIEAGRVIERGAAPENRRDFELVGRDEAMASLAATETPAFKRWFGKSKVVNADGSPKVVYHGTEADFETFEITGDFGFHFGSKLSANARIGASRQAVKETLARGGTEEHQEGRNIMPVYLRIENPLRMPDLDDWAGGAVIDELVKLGILDEELADSYWEDGNEIIVDREQVKKWLAEAGYDGIVYKNTNEGGGRGGDSYIVFDPEQIKSVHNRGDFSLTDPRILAAFPMPRSRGPVTFQAPIDSVNAAWAQINLPLFERLKLAGSAAWTPIRREAQDSMIDWKRVQDAIVEQTGSPIRAAADVYKMEIQFTGRTGKRLDDLMDDEVHPMVNAMAAAGVSMDDLIKYVSAKYAPKRNARIAQIDPTMPDGGSGITDAEAVQMMRELRQDGKLRKVARIAKLAYAMRDATRLRLLNAGLISQAQFDSLEDEPYYVPFQGFKDGPDEATRLAIGSKYDTRAAPVKRALGRKSKADNPIAYLLAQAQQSVVLAEKARVGRAVLRMAKTYPQSELWEVNQVVKVKYLDKQTGMVATFVDGRKRTMAPNVLAVRDGGKLYWVTLHHKGMLEGVKGMEGSQLHIILRGMRVLQRYYALMRTGLNPVFFVPNFLRDLETTAIHVTAEQGANILKDTLRDIPKAVAATWRHETMGQRGGSQWVQFAEEHALDGGKVGVFGLYDIEDTKKKLAKALRLAEGGTQADIENALDRGFEILMGVNGAIENAMRLSLYVNMRRAGFTRDEAAIASKEVTVNFNRKGTQGAKINAAYVFFNAAVQGTTRVFSVLRKHPKVRKAMLGAILVGFLLDMANAWMSGDSDDDGENDYDQKADYLKQRNLIIMWPWSDKGEGTTLPLTWVYNVFPYMGVQAGRVVRGRETPWGAAANVAWAIAQAANPLNAYDTLQMVLPTLFDPIGQLTTNKDYKGDPIVPDQKAYQVPLPDSQRYFTTVNPTFKALADELNTLSGGNAVRPGEIDISPETMEYWWDFAFGGVGNFLNQVYTTGATLASGEIPESRTIPFVRTLYTTTSPRTGRDEFYTLKERIDLAEEELAVYTAKRDARKVAEIRRDYKVDLSMVDDLKIAEKELRDLKKRIAEAKTTLQRKQFQDERDAVMSRFRRRYRLKGGKL